MSYRCLYFCCFLTMKTSQFWNEVFNRKFETRCCYVISWFLNGIDRKEDSSSCFSFSKTESFLTEERLGERTNKQTRSCPQHEMECDRWEAVGVLTTGLWREVIYPVAQSPALHTHRKSPALHGAALLVNQVFPHPYECCPWDRAKRRLRALTWLSWGWWHHYLYLWGWQGDHIFFFFLQCV